MNSSRHAFGYWSGYFHFCWKIIRQRRKSSFLVHLIWPTEENCFLNCCVCMLAILIIGFLIRPKEYELLMNEGYDKPYDERVQIASRKTGHLYCRGGITAFLKQAKRKPNLEFSKCHVIWYLAETAEHQLRIAFHRSCWSALMHFTICASHFYNKLTQTRTETSTVARLRIESHFSLFPTVH